MAEFSDRLKILRKETGLRQEDFAKEIKVATNTVSAWERGARKPDLPVMEMLAQWFHVPIEYLLGRTDDRREMSYEDAFGSNCAAEDISEAVQNMARRMVALSKESRRVLGATLNALYEMDAKSERLDLESKYTITVVPQYISPIGLKSDGVIDGVTIEADFDVLDD